MNDFPEESEEFVKQSLFFLVNNYLALSMQQVKLEINMAELFLLIITLSGSGMGCDMSTLLPPEILDSIGLPLAEKMRGGILDGIVSNINIEEEISKILNDE